MSTAGRKRGIQVGMALLAASLAASWMTGTGAQTESANTPEPPVTKAPRPTTIPKDLAGCSTAECHSETKAFTRLHGPMYVNACDACHVVVDPKLHLFKLPMAENLLCTNCHELELDDDLMLHEPVVRGACMDCHSPHGGATEDLLRSEQYGAMCVRCHDELSGAHNLSHGPAIAGACNACHEPHASKGRKLLELDGTALCLQCHVSLEVEIETARVVHEPVLNDCQLCHNPHETRNPSLLISEPTALCVRCHEDIHETVDHAKNPHGAILTERACLNCHSPHASDHERLLRNDVEQLCFTCHDKVIERSDGSLIANMKALIESGKSLHGPVSKGNCVACHEIHGGDNSRLLVREYTETMYVPFDASRYALCFGCHDEALVNLKQTTKATDFRNGDLNLHYVHVHRDKKGRSCGICHDAHAADRQRHIYETVPFGPGGWKLPIFFRRVEGGGSCASGCHQSLSYRRDDPVIYTPGPEGSKNLESDD